MADEKKLQQLYMQLQMASQQIRQLEEQISMLSSKAEELKSLKEGVKAIAETKEEKILFDVGSGIFSEGKLTNSDMIINVGANVFIKKSAADAIVSIEKQIELTNEYLAEMNENMQFLNQQAVAIQHEAQHALE